MADDAARHAEHRPRLGRGLAALLGDAGEEAPRRRRAAAHARRRSNSCAPIPTIPASRSTTTSSTSSPPRSASAASSSRCWCGRSRASPTPSRSSPASGAGARRSAPACTKFRSSSSRRATARRSNSPSSRTCSAPISTRSKRRRATPSSGRPRLRPRGHRAHHRQEPQPCRQHAAVDSTCRDHCRALLASGADLRRPCARAARASPIPTPSPTASSREGLTVRDVERLGERAGQTQRTRQAAEAWSTPTRARSRRSSASRSAPKSRSAIPATMANCASRSAISSSSTTSAAGCVSRPADTKSFKRAVPARLLPLSARHGRA